MNSMSEEKRFENIPISSEKSIQIYLQLIQFLDVSTDSYIYLADLKNDRVYFTDKIRSKFPLSKAGSEGNSSNDCCKIISERDRDRVMQRYQQLHTREDKTNDHLEYRLMDWKGDYCWVSGQGTVINDEKGQPIMVVGRISELESEHKIDCLTGLRNREKFVEDMELCIQENDGVLMVLDVDDFKSINMRSGQSFGNNILETIAEVLENNADSQTDLYRLDGDCFAANFVRKTKKDAGKFYQDVKNQLQSICTISAGAVEYTAKSKINAEQIHQYAESAMDRAKKDGKDRFFFFSQDKYQEKLESIELLDEIRAAVLNGCKGFYLCYQPQINSCSYGVYGAEVLLRFVSPTRGNVSPAEFIQLMEQNGLICPVGEWVLKTALKQCREWRKNLPDFRVSVNMSYLQLEQEGISDTVLNLLRETGLPGEALTVELTESMQLQDYQYFNNIFYKWKENGIKISIDDFGTGYSSLSYLKSIAIDEIKIDRCFVNQVQNNAYNYRLLNNMIELAHSAHIQVCCEGVETVDEMIALRELHTDLQQGFLFAKPCKSDVFEQSYICKESEAYQARKAKEAKFAQMESQESRKRLEELRKEEIANITENMEEVVYVSDVETHELYYLNGEGRRITGQYDYIGRKCYEVLQGRTSPCSICTNDTLCENKFHIWKVNNHFLNRQFITKEKLIPWQGKMARLEIGVDITQHEKLQEHQKGEISEPEFEQYVDNSSQNDVRRFGRSGIVALNKTGEQKPTTRQPACLQEDLVYVSTKKEHDERLSQLKGFCYEDILDKADLGLWVLLIDPKNLQCKLYGDRVWNRIMEISPGISPEDRYRYWFDNVVDGYKNYVYRALKRMVETDRVIQMEYTGNLPFSGETTFQSIGVRANKVDGMIYLEGYTRAINNLERSNILPYEANRDEFEYDEKKKSIYFHTTRELIAGDQEKERNFPECWIENEIVHPHYAEKFRNIFQNVQTKNEVNEPEMVLKNAAGVYEWFKIKTRKIGDKKRNVHTIVVMIEPTDAERTLKLECMRKMDFYEAMLSETVAYAELDVESGHLTRAGGLWKHYEMESRARKEKFDVVVGQGIKGLICPEDEAEYLRHLDLDHMRKMYNDGIYTSNYCFRRMVDHELYWMELITHIFKNQYTGNTYALLYLKNVDAEKKRELAQEAAAKMDSLTCLYNRRAFEQEVIQFMESEQENPKGAFIMLDLDNFKIINDTYGHLKGDEVLKSLSRILKQTFRNQDIIGRLGGDEFVVFVKNITEEKLLNQKVEELFCSLAQVEEMALACSVGISLVQKKDFNYSAMVSQADNALYQSKNEGKNRYNYY